MKNKEFSNRLFRLLKVIYLGLFGTILILGIMFIYRLHIQEQIHKALVSREIPKYEAIEIVNNRPEGVTPKDIIDGLISRGYTIEGFDLEKYGYSKLEILEQQKTVQKSVENITPKYFNISTFILILKIFIYSGLLYAFFFNFLPKIGRYIWNDEKIF